MQFSKLLTVVALCLTANISQAGVAVFKSENSEKLYIQDDLESKTNVAYIKFTGIETAWTNKIIKVNHKNQKYFFKYFLDLSSGKKEREYYLAIEEGSKRINGTDCKHITLYLQNNKKIEFYHDQDLTAKSETMNLIQEFKKSPFTPEVD